MSDNTSEEEQQQQMREIFICADVWLKVFDFVSPLELGHTMALISERFDDLVDVHFKTRKWSLDWVHIYRAIGGNGAEIVKYYGGPRLPIPRGPLPVKVIGFKGIWISYVDQTVIEFLQRIRRLFDSSETTVAIDTGYYQNCSWEIIRQKIWPLINDNICRLLMDSFAQIDQLRQFSPTVLRNCAKLRLIDSYDYSPDFSDEDNAEVSDAQAMAKWLLTPREDGLPKILRWSWNWLQMEGLKMSFVNALEPVNFIIGVRGLLHFTQPFGLENTLTGERLTFRRFIENYWLLVRCPIGREEAKWAAWENEALEWEWCREWNRIAIDFNDRDIGDGMVDEKAGPSEPKK